jgi:RNA-directed DNA polymerase
MAAFEDKVVQDALREVLEAVCEQDFLPCSFGFRPGRSAHDAIRALHREAEQGVLNWVLEADVVSFFDHLDHALVMKAVRHHDKTPRVLLCIQRWLKAPVQRQDGSQQERTKGSPQGAVVSPLLANLFLHHAFDDWMRRNHPSIPFERYADDVIVHANSKAQAEQLPEAIRGRLAECGLELHPEKTKIVYCQDSDRKGQHEHIRFDFLGYTFRPRRAKNYRGKPFASFLPGGSNKAGQAIRATIRDGRLAATRNNQSLEDLARLVNPSVGGWVNDCGRFYRSALTPVLRHLERALIRWACRKYKRFRGHVTNAAHWLGRVACGDPNLFVLWQIGIRPATGS